MRNRKLLAAVLSLCLLLSLLPASAFADAFDEGTGEEELLWGGDAGWDDTPAFWEDWAEPEDEASFEPESEDPFEELDPWGEGDTGEVFESQPDEEELPPVEEDPFLYEEEELFREEESEAEEEPADAFEEEPQEEEQLLIEDEAVFVSFTTEPETALTGLTVLDAEGLEQLPWTDPDSGETLNGVYLLQPGSYLYRFYDENGEYEDLEGSFEVEASQEPLSIVLTLEPVATFEILTSFYINPIYDTVITEDDLPAVPVEILEALQAQEEAPLFYSRRATFRASQVDVLATYPEINDTPIDSDIGEVVSRYKEKLMAHEDTIIVRYYSESLAANNENWNALRLQIHEDALVHTGAPTEGDYLRYNLVGYSSVGLLGKGEGDNGAVFTFVFLPAYAASAEQEAQAGTAAASILASLDLAGKEPYQKVKAIYDYLCENVRYDTTHEDSYNVQFSAYSALVENYSVCQGIATAFYRLCLSAGVDTRVVTREGSSGVEAHAWNIVKLGNVYYELDATWDRKELRSEYIYFLGCSANWADNGHLTLGDEFDDADFAARYPLSAEDYTVGAGTIYSVSLVFKGIIEMKYYFILTPEQRADTGAYLLLQRSGSEIARYPLPSGAYDAGTGMSSFNIGIAPAALATPITAKLFWGDGTAITLKDSYGGEYPQGFSFSPMEYARQMSTRASTQAMRDLAAALKDYGIAAESYFKNTNTSGLSLSSAVDAVQVSDLAPYAIGVSGTKPYGCSLARVTAIFQEDNSLRIYFEYDNGKSAGDFTYAVDGASAEIRTRTDASGTTYYYLTVENVPAAQLDTPHTFSISDGTNTYVITSSVLGYAHAALSTSSASSGIKVLAKALYLYNAAANTYFNK